MTKQPTLFDAIEKESIEGLYSVDQIYESTDGHLFSRLTEDHRFDRKRANIDSKKMAVMLSSFGNGPSVHGGVIAMGVENDGSISGCKHLSELDIQKVEKFGSDICPDGRFSTQRLEVTNKDGDDDFIILVRIRYVEGRLVTLTNGNAYIRVGDTDKVVDDARREEIRIDKGERSFELEPCGLQYPDEFDVPKIQVFCNKIRNDRDSVTGLSDEAILQSMYLGKNKGNVFVANNACALIFAQAPMEVFPGCRVHFLRYAGTRAGSGSEYNVVKDRQFTGPIPQIIKDASSFIETNLREFTKFDGSFSVVAEYPRDAWYELLVNALSHRSYHIKNAKVFVRMFDDHLEVESPGGFMPQITPETIFGNHRPRNPFLMDILREYGEVRCISEGTMRIKQELRSASLPEPEFREDTSPGICVKAIIRNDIANRTNSLDSEAYKTLGHTRAFSLNGNEQKIVNYLIEYGKINVNQALKIVTVKDWHTAKGILESLKERGVVDHISKQFRDPKAHYILNREGK